MTKRILALVLVLVMTMAMLPVSLVSAEEIKTAPVQASPKAGTHTDAGHADDCGVTEGWQAWESDNSLPTSGKYYLTKDVTLTKEHNTIDGELHLCLNGYVIKQTAKARVMSIKDMSGGKLIISDCTAYEEDGVYYAGVVTGGNDQTKSTGGGCIFVRKSTELHVYDGRFVGNRSQYAGGCFLTQAAGTVSGVSYPAGKIFIHGGEFADNMAIKDGAAQPGGVVYLNGNSPLKITGGFFHDNKASNGGVIYGATTTVEISGATFKNNTATYSGSVLHNNGGMQLTIGDGTVITGNVGTNTAATGWSSAVHMRGSAGKLTLTGKVYIANNTAGATGIASLNFSQAASDTVYVNELAAGSYVEMSTTATVPADASEVIAINGTQTAWSSAWIAHMAQDGTLTHIGKDDAGFKFVDGHFHEGVEYLPLTDANQLIAGGAYYLAGDVTLTKAVALADGVETSICLNGHKLTSTFTAEATFQTVDNNAKATFNIDDCTAYTDAEGVYHAGSIDGIENKATGHGGIFMIRNSGTLNIYNGKFTNNAANQVGGVAHINGTVNVYGGYFANNTSKLKGTTKSDGGVFFVNSQGKGYVENATFHKNESTKGGGAIYSNGILTVKNCVFTENKAAAGGGAVAVLGSQKNLIEGSVFTGNTSSTASAINIGASTVIITLRDIEVTNNANTAGYGAVNFVGNVVKPKLEGKIIIKDNTGVNQTNLSMQKGSCVLDVTGLAADSYIVIGLLNDRFNVAEQRVFTTASASNNKDYFYSERDGYIVELNADNKLELVEGAVTPPVGDGHKHTLCNDTGCTEHTAEVTYEAWTDATKLPTEGNWYLDTDVTVTAEKQIKTATTLNLCLNGHTISGFTANGARAYSTTANTVTTINISDCTAKTENGVYTAGKFTGFNNTHTDSGGSAIYIRAKSHLNFFDGIVEGNNASSGGAIYIHTATANIYNGLITNNTSHKNNGETWVSGAGLFMYKATVNVYGGTISNNKASYGAGIHLADGTCQLLLKDVTITGNVATGEGGGVNAAYAAAKLTISGNTVITGNTKADGSTNNLRLGSTGNIIVENLGKNAQVGITANGDRAFSNVVASDVSDQFPSDDTNYITYLDGDSKLALMPAVTHDHCICGKADCTDDTHEKIKFLAWTKEDSLPSSGNYCLTKDVVMPAQGRVENATVNLCLNGHTVSVGTQGSRVYYMTNNSVLTITDCQGTGKLTNANKGAILSNSAGKNQVLNLYAGTITDNHANGTGGALVLQGETTFNMYGGFITNNSATSYLSYNADGTVKLDANGNQVATGSHAGGVYMAGTGTFNMYGGEISGNKANYVEYFKAGATSATKTGGYGGGVYLTTSVANLYGGKICGNEGYLGGGIFISGAGAQLNLMGTEVSGNHGQNAGGGLISQTHAVVNLKSSEVKENTCVGAGAGMYISTGTTLNMTGGKVTGNIGTDGTNYKSGAGMYLLASTANISGGEISYNKGYSGAAICMGTSGTRVSTLNLSGDYLIIGNQAQGNGGAVFCTGDGAKITMTSGTITKNKSSNGGGIITQTGTTFEMSGGTISYNEATASGGGVYISTKTTFKMTGGSIVHNTSKSSGGGLVGLRAKVTLSGGTISYNTGSEGGGVKANGGTVTFGGVTITGNRAIGTLNKTTGKYTGGNGGGIVIGRAGYKVDGVQMYEYPNIYVNSPYVAYNKANGAAGGMLVQSDGTKFYMYGGTFAYNEAPNSSGGGIYFSTKSRPNVYGGNVYGNKAKNAGGVYFLNTTAVFENVKIHDNETTSSSAGMIATGKDTIIEAKNIELYDNVSLSASGAIAVQGYATMNLDGGKFYGNISKTAGGAIYFSNPGYGTWKNIEVYENESLEGYAGGMFVGAGSRLSIENATFRDNKAGTSFGGAIHNRGRLDLYNVKILNNECVEGAGGGISGANVSSTIMGQDGGTYIYDSIISGNKAALQGGGVFGHRGCPTYLENCTVTDNVAGMEGGGVYANGRCGVVNTTVTGNISGGEGFAVYFTASEFDGQSYTTGHKKIGGNMIIKDNEGGNFYMGEGSAVAVVGGPLGEKSYMEITLHSGVLSEHLFGEYDYEGGDLEYIVTAGNRSLTDPEKYEYYQAPAEESQEEAKAPAGDVLLYVGIGVIGLAAIAAAVLVILKKKKSAVAGNK